MLRTVRAQLEAFPGYVVVLAGMFAEMSNRTGLDIYYFRSFNGRCSGVTCGYLCQVEYPMGGRPIVYFWCVFFFSYSLGEKALQYLRNAQASRALATRRLQIFLSQ